jgi:hypothetical protein
MISDKFIRGQLYSEFTAQVLRTAGPKILTEQANRVESYYTRQSGHIADQLRTQSFKVQKMGDGAVLEFDYLIDLRFLDMKTTALGHKKQVYGPVYNRPLWGYVYGYIFGTLRYGLSETIQAYIFDAIRESYKKPLEQ